MSIVLNILNQVTPSAHLRADVHELRHNGQQKMPMAQQVMEVAVTAAVFMLVTNNRKFLD